MLPLHASGRTCPERRRTPSPITNERLKSPISTTTTATVLQLGLLHMGCFVHNAPNPTLQVQRGVYMGVT
jgi:hypothetical protein